MRPAEIESSWPYTYSYTYSYTDFRALIEYVYEYEYVYGRKLTVPDPLPESLITDTAVGTCGQMPGTATMPGTERKTVDRFWAEDLADQVLAGVPLDRESALRVLRASDGEVPALLEATRRVREHHHGRRVKLCVLRNARSGICPEDCHYCSQSAVSKAAIPRYKMDSVEELFDGARRAAATGARRYCMVTSGRGPSAADIERFAGAARCIKVDYPEMEICVSAGLLDETQARDLKAAGVGWVNHNLNTSERHHAAICSTHTYADRIRTIENVKRAGMATCCGGIIGMGEDDEDIVDLAFALRDLKVDSLPVNFLLAIDGTPLADRNDLTPQRCLRALCLFRLTNPAAEIRIAGGRERHLAEFQPQALYAANSIFVEGYLTTPGQAYGEAHEMIAGMGFEVEAGVEPIPFAPDRGA